MRLERQLFVHVNVRHDLRLSLEVVGSEHGNHKFALLRRGLDIVVGLPVLQLLALQLVQLAQVLLAVVPLHHVLVVQDDQLLRVGCREVLPRKLKSAITLCTLRSPQSPGPSTGFHLTTQRIFSRKPSRHSTRSTTKIPFDISSTLC